ncbi:response regulator [Aureimonas flava]|uniref:Response regulator n=1 Tax=Aureimonas flava TaxID=2320271 RepID=A0A3A1WHP4_9HYPH|nr:response regulator [Aureimonas flava]RIX98722.1 response regulator [Aureimonas flava]
MSTCLVIDESSIVAKVAARILGGIGLETLGSESMEEAARVLGKPGADAPVLVLVSASLQSTTIEASVRALRADPRTAKARILVSLVESNLGTMTRAKRAGADGFIFRPFDRASLLDWVGPFVEAATPAAA